MILIGMFDSPFVRRVAVSMHLLDLPFEHRNWSVGKDFDQNSPLQPAGRVPTLVLDDGESLIESAAILDYLDELAGPQRALLPRSGSARRDALHLMSMPSARRKRASCSCTKGLPPAGQAPPTLGGSLQAPDACWARGTGTSIR